MIYFFNVGHTYQNGHNMLQNFPRYLLQTSKTDNNALDVDAIYNLRLRKTQPNSADSFTIKLNAKFPWPSIMPKQRECILFFVSVFSG
jgi:hypothetical protein